MFEDKVIDLLLELKGDGSYADLRAKVKTAGVEVSSSWLFALCTRRITSASAKRIEELYEVLTGNKFSIDGELRAELK